MSNPERPDLSYFRDGVVRDLRAESKRLEALSTQVDKATLADEIENSIHAAYLLGREAARRPHP